MYRPENGLWDGRQSAVEIHEGSLGAYISPRLQKVSQLQAGKQQQWKENLNHQMRIISSTSLRFLKSLSIVYSLA